MVIGVIAGRSLFAEPRDPVRANEPRITLDLAGPTLKGLFDQLIKQGGLSCVFEESVQTQLGHILPTFSIRDLPVTKAFEILAQATNLAAVPVDSNTWLIVPKGRLQEYSMGAHWVMRLTYADAVKLQAALQQTVPTIRLVADEVRNQLLAFGSPTQLEELKSLITSLDRRNPQVVFELHVAELTWQKNRQIGVELNDYQISSLKVLPPGAFSHLGYADFPALFKYLQTVSDVKLLANPRIQVVDRVKATINLVNKVSFATTRTSIAAGTPQTGAVPTTVTTQEIGYADIGIKLTVTPTIQTPKEVVVELEVESTSLGKTNPLTLIPDIGSRKATTSLRLMSGEFTVLGGLKQEEERYVQKGIPFLMDIPLLGALFTSHTAEKVKSEIVISLKPTILWGDGDIQVPAPAK